MPKSKRNSASVSPNPNWAKKAKKLGKKVKDGDEAVVVETEPEGPVENVNREASSAEMTEKRSSDKVEDSKALLLLPSASASLIPSESLPSASTSMIPFESPPEDEKQRILAKKERKKKEEKNRLRRRKAKEMEKEKRKADAESGNRKREELLTSLTSSGLYIPLFTEKESGVVRKELKMKREKGFKIPLWTCLRKLEKGGGGEAGGGGGAGGEGGDPGKPAAKVGKTVVLDDTREDDDDDDDNSGEVFRLTAPLHRADDKDDDRNNDSVIVLPPPGERDDENAEELLLDQPENPDDSVCVTRHKVVRVCPITKLPFVKPVKNVCGHVYEKSAIYAMNDARIRRGKVILDCPVPGCQLVVFANRLEAV